MSYYDQLSALGIKLARRYGQEKVQCPKCYDGRKNKNKKDLSVNITTGEYCCHNDGCDFKGNVRLKENHQKKAFIKLDQNLATNKSLDQRQLKWLDSRGISEATLNRYMVYGKKEFMPQTDKEENCICFPYFKNSSLVNIKFRDAAKNFKMVKEAELSLFGLQFLRGRKKIIITEGEIDALSLAEIGYGKEEGDKIEKIDHSSGEIEEIPVNEEKTKWVPLSVPNGASDKGQMLLEYLDNCFEQLIDIEEFIIATDGDSAGLRLKDELIRRLGIERCRFVQYPLNEVVLLTNNLKRKCKDLNEVLLHLGANSVDECLRDAKFVPIEGVYYLQDLYPRMLEKFRTGLLLGETTRLGAEMDEHFRWKVGDLNVGVGYANAGKTFFQNQMDLAKSIYDGWKHAVYCPENFPADDFYDDLIEPFIGKPLTRMSEEEYVFATRFIGDHFFYVYPEDEHDLTSIFERFRNLILKKGVNNVRIDPFNQLDRERSQYSMSIEERLSIELKRCKRFALQNAITFSILAHPKNPLDFLDRATRQLPVVDIYNISGGAQWANKADNVWSYYRPRYHEDKEDPSVEVYWQKIKRKRTGGKLGKVELRLNISTKRFQNSVGEELCDPILAKKILRSENFKTGIATTLFDEDLYKIENFPDQSNDEPMSGDEPPSDLPF